MPRGRYCGRHRASVTRRTQQQFRHLMQSARRKNKRTDRHERWYRRTASCCMHARGGWGRRAATERLTPCVASPFACPQGGQPVESGLRSVLIRDATTMVTAKMRFRRCLHYARSSAISRDRLNFHKKPLKPWTPRMIVGGAISMRWKPFNWEVASGRQMRLDVLSNTPGWIRVNLAWIRSLGLRAPLGWTRAGKEPPRAPALRVDDGHLSCSRCPSMYRVPTFSSN